LCRSFKSAVAHINRRTDKKIPIDRNPPILVDPIIGLNPILEKITRAFFKSTHGEISCVAEAD
jgi:hypothetical protein